MAAFTANEMRENSGTVCIPLIDRDNAVNAVIELQGVASAAAVERSVRDFKRPFGLLAQISASTTATAEIRRWWHKRS